MKLIYQQMLAFLGVIMATLLIVSVFFIRNTTEIMYDTTWKQLEGYADVIQAKAFGNVGSVGAPSITYDFIHSSEDILSKQNVHFAFYNGQNNLIYPTPSKSGLPENYWKELKAGKTIKLKRIEGNNKSAQTVILRPVFYNNKLSFVIWVGSNVDNIQSNIDKMERNLFVTLIISSICALVLSYILARFQTKRISRLRDASRQISSGNYDVNVPSKNRDEIDDLSRDFNHMASSLQDKDEEIHRQEERRRQFMADAAHEMRTPLTTINGLLEGLAYDAIPEEAKDKSIELMRNETDRLIRLVNENLDYEKLRTNQIILNETTFDATKAIQNIITQLTQKAKNANDQLVFEHKGDVSVYADYDRFVQIIFNVMQNAIQFTKDGTVTTTLSRGYEETIVTIQDTGIGMTQDEVKNIWDRYYKADPSRKNTKYGESGLGLAIVHQLIQQHHGTIDVTSEKGKGTKFTLTFPDKDSDTNSTAKEKPSEPQDK